MTSRFLSHRFLLALALGVALAAQAQQPPAAPDPAAAPAPAAAAPADEPKKKETVDDAAPAQPDATQETRPARGGPRRSRDRGASNVTFGDQTVPAGARAHHVVSMVGSSVIEGDVDSDVVSIVGRTHIGPEAKVGGGAVAILGGLDVAGTVGRDAVSVLGGGKVSGHIRGGFVSILGDAELTPTAVVDGQVVVIGGTLHRSPEAVVRGDVVNVPFGGDWGHIEWLVTWIKRCALWGRPLAFGAHLGWAWAIACSFLAFYLLLALLFPRGVEKCVKTFETRPGYSILSSVLTVFLTPVALVLLAVTVVGAVVVPFVLIGLFFAGLFGKAVLLAWIGGRFTRLFGDRGPSAPVLAVLIGGVFVLLLYTVPVVGFLLYKLLSWLGLGVVVYTIALAMKREKPAAPGGAAPEAGGVPPPTMPPAPGVAAAATSAFAAAQPVAAMAPESVAASATPTPTITPPEPVASAPFAGPDVPRVSSGFVGSDAGPVISPPPAFSSPPPLPASFAAPRPPRVPPAPVIAAATFPRASFLIRMAALLLDLVLVGLVVAFVTGMVPRGLRIEPPSVLLLLAIYGAVMWKLRGTTIGGIVCGLKVVRLDDRPIDWPTSIVRALSCFLSLVVAGLGFFWIAIDDEKQSWHDKIAGTVVVRVPKGVSLL